MLNKVILNGNLVRDPQAEEGAKFGFITIACQRGFKNKDGVYETDFIPVMITGDKVVAHYCKNFKKGDGVILEGELRMKPNKYDVDGKATEVSVISSAWPSFAAGKKKNEGAPANSSTSPEGEFNVADDSDDDLPF